MRDYIIVVMKKSQRIPFQGRHKCRLTTEMNHKETDGRALTGDIRSLLTICNK